MQFSKFCIDHPIFASVLSILTVIIGMVAYFALPIEQYPEIAPPTIQIKAQYPGANARTVSETVATPIEQEINGVEGMIYMISQATADGNMTITVTFELGTDLDMAQVLVQNRVSIAAARLPEEVRRLGVITRKNSPDLMMVVNLFSPDGTYDQNYIGNYVILKVRDRIRRLKGIGDTMMVGGAEYAMRIWLDPDAVNNLHLTAGDIISAIRAQNVQVAAGILNQSPQIKQNVFEYSLQTQGRLANPEQFEDIIIKSGADGHIVRLRDVAKVELGVENYLTKGLIGELPSVAIPIFQLPGSNALDTAQAVIDTMKELSADFPPGLKYEIAYNPTEFVAESIDSVKHTLYEAIALVVLVIMVFLQSWRTAVIPIIAIPVSLIGTFAVMAALGFSLNSLTLFGLVLAIGIVVDDAIVVVENMERNMRNGLSTLEAARITMEEVGGALIGMGLVLTAVFIPTLFMTGISGQFYRQFGVVIAVSTVISVLVSLTLSPALAAILVKLHDHHTGDLSGPWYHHPLIHFFRKFDAAFEWLSIKYAGIVRKMVKQIGVVLLGYACLMVITGYMFHKVPTGFIPPQDQGFFIISIQLPSGHSLSETTRIVQEANSILMKMDGVLNTVSLVGFSGATFTNATNAAAIFPVLDTFKNRKAKGVTYESLLKEMRLRMLQIKGAFVVVIPPAPVRGMGASGGFRMMIQDKNGLGLDVLEKATWTLAAAANQEAATTSVFTFFENKTPQLYIDIDREKAERLRVPASRIFEALGVFIGSSFVNDFNYLGRTFRVTAQADHAHRLTPDDVLRIQVRNTDGEMVSIGSLATVHDTMGPSRIPRYNLYPSAELMGDTKPGYSSGEGLSTMERLAKTLLPEGIGFEWTEIAYQETHSGNTAAVAFIMAVVFVFLLLAAQYESWTLPLSVILIVPMCLFSAISGIALVGMDNNILVQIGLVVLIGLASKNAILIVEFARDLESSKGMDHWEAAIEAAKLRLRPIVMTSFAFILGVVPLVLAEGAGAEMRRALGTAVFFGMIGVTCFGLLFTPVFYVLCRTLSISAQGLKNKIPSKKHELKS